MLDKFGPCHCVEIDAQLNGVDDGDIETESEKKNLR